MSEPEVIGRTILTESTFGVYGHLRQYPKKGLVKAHDIARMLSIPGVNAHKINLWLVKEGYCYKDKSGIVIPVEKSFDEGLFKELICDEPPKACIRAYFTDKGVNLLSRRRAAIAASFGPAGEV
jgi:hypothetical protein